MSNKKIGIIGSGLIGRSWAMIFAAAGYKVSLYDIDSQQIEVALADINQQLQTLEKEKVLRGTLTGKQQFALISGTTSLAETVKDATIVQECVPEVLDLKRKVWKQVDDIASPNTILSSSTSTFMPSLFSDHLKNKKNIIVSHPVNPPYYVPVVEVVPAPWTDPEVAKKTRAIWEEVGQTPVSLTKEVPGFIINRLQYAVLNEAWHLVTEGVLDVKDVDKVMSEGLGMRYAFLGTLETTHLNEQGFVNYCKRYGDTIYAVSKDFKPTPKFEGPHVLEIAKQLEADVPLDKLQERRNWRDLCLTKLSQLKTEMNKLK
ncbi:lambda-crystallin homolog [Diabrotica virgifera virgifera]|uniref:Lambda-crystallin homolog n=1 Tax=Diabrotica virgifera virgifera TaxID=50390 RepID=A0A6P7F670_DIAVI|nr:lambda-crystallin homolog [Diabrotica virgifera virgifera]XP_050499096.1 lambda-crystallin homolog [Diabrotica virgifera virgifera]XP_050499097.1 lambda-crystallin homolog [Diabrotica virgifera virgifera]